MFLLDTFAIATSLLSPPYHRLFLVSDGSDWVLRQEALSLAAVARSIGVPATVINPPRISAPQCFHFTSQFAFSNPRFSRTSRRMSVDFFHGSSQTNPHFMKSLEALRSFKGEVLRVRVSNQRVHNWLVDAGIESTTIHRIPIGIRGDLFSPASTAQRVAVRAKLGIPQDAFVVGSFQKDGVGWGAGMEPKLIKGPDTLVKALDGARKLIPNLWVLLSGPSRGYVKSGLERSNIPYRHVLMSRYEDIASLYHSLDAYLIGARDEGGPKGFLESLASGVICISTRVGQVEDLATDNETALLSDIDDTATLTRHLVRSAQLQSDERSRIIASGRALAAAHTYEAPQALWKKFFTDYVIS